ncbi:haloacid dehalogenase type II [Geodermatophilus sp. URMC 63]
MTVEVQALVFDVFGTVVDWRGGVAREAARLLGPDVDAAAFADAWRARYQPALDRVRSGERPWTVLGALHRESLPEALASVGVDGVTGDVAGELVLAWHRLDPWPDAVAGLTRLRRSHVLAPLSNGGVRLSVDLARRAGLPWDLVLGAEVAGHYKPDPEVYDSAPRLLDVPPSAVCMVAAHTDDLAAARARGLRTAYVHRPDEFGGDPVPPAADPDADLSVASFEELATTLGC